MSRGWTASWLALLAIAGPVVSGAGAEERPAARLRFNPFDAPAPGEPPAGRRPSDDESEWSAQLRGTLVAGPDSLADLGGVILRIGEETRGYRLLEVGAFEAVFLHDGERVSLPIPEMSAAEGRGR